MFGETVATRASGSEKVPGRVAEVRKGGGRGRKEGRERGCGEGWLEGAKKEGRRGQVGKWGGAAEETMNAVGEKRCGWDGGEMAMRGGFAGKDA